VTLETWLFPRGFERIPGTPPTFRIFESENGEVSNRGAFDGFRTEANKSRAALKNEQFVRAFNEEIRRRSDKVKGLQQFAGPQLDEARRDLERWQRAKESHEEAIKFTEDAEKWCDEMLRFFDKIERELRIGYRVYIVVEGQEIELVRTVDGESAAAAEGFE
jgi:hypothetical protein